MSLEINTLLNELIINLKLKMDEISLCVSDDDISVNSLKENKPSNRLSTRKIKAKTFENDKKKLLNNSPSKTRNLNDSDLKNVLISAEESSTSFSEEEESCSGEWLVSKSPCKKPSSCPAVRGSLSHINTRSKKTVSPVKLKRKSDYNGSSEVPNKLSNNHKLFDLENVTKVVEEKIKEISLRTPESKRMVSSKVPNAVRHSPRSAKRSLNYCELSPTKKSPQTRECQTFKGTSQKKDHRKSSTISSPIRSTQKSNSPFPPSPLLKDGCRDSKRPGLRISPKVSRDSDFIYMENKSHTIASPRTPSTSLRKLVLESRTPVSPKKKLIMDDDEEDRKTTPKKGSKEKTTKTTNVTPSKKTPLKDTSNSAIGKGFLTPVHTPLKESYLSAMEKLSLQLHVSSLPTSLACREDEFNNIRTFVERKIVAGLSGCMYISGVPGTGKTATVHNVIKSLQKDYAEENFPEFDFVELNGLRLTEPRQAYVRLWRGLTGNKVPKEQALRLLEKKFSSKPKKSTVFLVDELDYVCNRRQDVIYNILDWPSKKDSKLIVLAIANTMDLPERTLKGKVTSRMGLTRLVFQPYTFKQLQEIVTHRMSGSKHFHVDAVQLVSRKVAAVSGDARRALGICRRAIELLDDKNGTVTLDHIAKVLNEIFSGPRVTAIKNASFMEQMVLRAIRDETLRTGIEETSVKDIYSHFSSLCHLEGTWVPHIGDVLCMCRSLAASGILTAESGNKDVFTKISLNVSPDDIHYALSN